MKITYQQKLTFSFLIIFVFFTAGIIVFEKYRAGKFKTEALEEKLDICSDIIHHYIQQNPEDQISGENLLRIFPEDIRITVINISGDVLYDNIFADRNQLENHADRPEIREAERKGKGSDIRTSASNQLDYLYYAKYFGDTYVRVALPYNVEIQDFLKPDNAFLYFILIWFMAGLLFIHYVGGRFGKSIRKLRDFSRNTIQRKEGITSIRFPDDELGEIGDQIVKEYIKLKDNQLKLSQEKAKLLQHVHSSAEGVCFFNPDMSVAFYNGLFLQYLTIISNDTDLETANFLYDDIFRPVRSFIESDSPETYYETRIANQGKDFFVRVNIFNDHSFEIVLNDITYQEKTRKLKHELTGNISHELRTPVTSIRGYLETILHSSMSDEQQRMFIEKAHLQTLTLSELISDMGLLSKLDDVPDTFSFREIELGTVIERIKSDLSEQLKQKSIRFTYHFKPGLVIKGNENLIYSIFYNLTDNAIKYAGENITIDIRQLEIKDGFVYLSFTDTGKGIEDENQLPRIFERFYRVDDGRTRETGGSGLGLSIVKNAITFHGGSILVRNLQGGGLVFIMNLPVA